jgi:hypothetical protein
MSREHNEHIMRTYLEEVVANERLELIPEIANESMVDEASALQGGPPGRDGLVAHVQVFHNAMLDRTITIRKIMATDDEVMAWWTGEGTVDTGQKLTGYAFSFFTITDRKISRYRLFSVFASDPPTYFDSTPAQDIPAPLEATP